MVYFLLNVDDMLISCTEIEYIDKIKSMLKSEFEMKELGPAKWIIGIKTNIDKK